MTCPVCKSEENNEIEVVTNAELDEGFNISIFNMGGAVELAKLKLKVCKNCGVVRK